MPTTTASSVSPIQGAVQKSNEIRVTTAIEQHIRFDINSLNHLSLSNGSWKSCYVLTDQIEPKYSDWYQIKSARGLHIVGKCCNGKFYEVAVHESYIPWLLRHNFDFLPCLDVGVDVGVNRAEPTDAEIRVHGIPAARKRARASFLLNIINAIKSGHSPGLVSYFRHIVPLSLRISLEWAILSHEILESDPQIRNKFVFCLLLIALSLNHDYSCPTVVELLEKNQDKLLQDFRKVYIDLLDATASKQILQFHFIALVRALFTFCGGRENVLQQEFYLGYTVSQNADFFGCLVGITGSHCFGSFITQEMLKALSLSKAVANGDVNLLDIWGLVHQMMDSLPIGFPQGYLDIPAKLLYGLGKGEVDQIRVQIAYFYRTQPSLQIPENNILVLFTSSIFQGQPLRVLSTWAASDDGRGLYQRLIKDIQHIQTTEQLALTLAALLCYQRILLYFSNNTTQSIKSCSYLRDFGALIDGELSRDERAVLEHMVISFLHALRTFGDGHQEIRRFLATLIDTETPVERPSIEYWVRRINYKLPHGELSLRQHYCWWAFVPAVLYSGLRGLWTALAGLFTFSTIYALQIFPHQVCPLTAQPPRQHSGVTWGEIPDIEKAPDVDTVHTKKRCCSKNSEGNLTAGAQHNLVQGKCTV